MTKLIEVKLDDDSTIYIEAEEIATVHDPELAATNSNGGKVGMDFLDKVSESTVKTINAIKDSFKNMGQNTPDELELSLNLKISSEANVIVAKLDKEANLGIKLKWEKNSLTSDSKTQADHD